MPGPTPPESTATPPKSAAAAPAPDAPPGVNGERPSTEQSSYASGARVLTTLIYEMQKRDAKKGLATLCIGGGMGIAVCVERD